MIRKINNDDENSEVDFGYQSVSPEEKPFLVQGLFDRVASKYDLMNDIMSIGIHRIWKRRMIEQLNPIA